MDQNALQQYQQQQNQAPSLPDPSLLDTSSDGIIPATSLQALTQSREQLQAKLNDFKGINNGPYGPAPAGMSQQGWVNMCEKLAESMTGNHQTGKFPTAAAAESFYQQSGQMNPNVGNAPAGSVIYFQPDNTNGYMGHAAVVNKNGSLTMSDNAGIQTFPSLQAWAQYSGQTPVGYVVPKS